MVGRRWFIQHSERGHRCMHHSILHCYQCYVLMLAVCDLLLDRQQWQFRRRQHATGVCNHHISPHCGCCASLPTNVVITSVPSTSPTVIGWLSPTPAPSTFKPTKYPTYSPTCKPTQEPSSAVPTYSPTPEPTHYTYAPTMELTHPTYEPTTVAPTVAPSMEPSLNPTFAPVAADAPAVTVQATHTVAGVTSDSAYFRTAFASAVKSLLPTGSTVAIVSVTVINVRRRQLLATAVSVVYTVQSTAPASTLTSSLSSGTAAMTAVLQQSYPATTVAAPTVVAIANPTAAPTIESTTSKLAVTVAVVAVAMLPLGFLSAPGSVMTSCSCCSSQVICGADEDSPKETRPSRYKHLHLRTCRSRTIAPGLLFDLDAAFDLLVRVQL